MFQCPTSGFFLFYEHKNCFVKQGGFVSMPYFGLLSFLPLSAVWHDKTVQSVSMPYFGLLSFLRYVSAPIDFTGFPASIL